MLTRLLPITLRKAFEKGYDANSFLYRALIQHYLGKLKRGRLVIEDPLAGDPLVLGQGSEVQARIRVFHQDFYRKLVFATDIGLGESYVDGDWDTDDIGAVIRWFIINIKESPSMSGGKSTGNILVNALESVNRAQHLLKANSVRGSKRNISDHYDLGNEFFASFLDETMMYSAGLFRDTEDLYTAQIKKLQSLAELADVKAQHHVLEIGTGWGEFACFLAKEIGCQVTSLTISDQQFAYARQKVRDRGLEGKVTVLNRDYRLYQGQFDRVVTIEMIEAIGHDYLPAFFKKCESWLKPGGLMAHQVILCPDSRYEEFRKGIDWIQKHIFPGSLLPSLSSLLTAANQDGHEFVLAHYLDMGLDYAETLVKWQENFQSNFSKLYQFGFDQRFRRKWNYYLAYCEAAFRMRNITVAQLVLTRPNNYLLH